MWAPGSTTDPVTRDPPPIVAGPTTLSTTTASAAMSAPGSIGATTSARRPLTRSRLARRYSSGRPASIQ